MPMKVLKQLCVRVRACACVRVRACACVRVGGSHANFEIGWIYI